MSIKKAQSIANQLYARYGLDLVAYQNDEITQLKDQLEEFVELEVDTDELEVPEDCADDLEDLEADED